MSLSYPTIAKTVAQPPAPNLEVYSPQPPASWWAEARTELEGLPGGALNIAHEAVDRHAHGAAADRTALRCLRRNGTTSDISYAELAVATNRFANILSGLGVERGDVVCTVCGRSPELFVSALGTLKRGAVYSPLFAAFGPEPLRTRLSLAQARVVVTTPAIYARKIQALRPSLPHLRHVILVDADESELPPATHDYESLMAAAAGDFQIAATRPEDVALIHFTSGTTGTPKGAVHVHEAVVAHHITGKIVLDLHPADVYWCTADPGWVTGTSYGIISPLTNAVSSIVDEGDFEPERWYEILEREAVSVWYTAPTAIRMLMKAGIELAQNHRLDHLRFLASVGEPLNPEAVVWGEEAFGLPFHDNWWQTETGGIMVANYRCMDVRPGSMGRPLPGVEAAVVRRTRSGVEIVDDPGEQGELALRIGWPSMFRGYLNEPERYDRAFAGEYYLSGDVVRRDRDGYFWFVGRSDDVIKTSGHLIGPFEVESILLEQPAVAESAVVGLPDPVAGEVVSAFVVLKPGFERSDALGRQLLAHCRSKLGAAVAPKSVLFVDALPHTGSGKILRRLVRARHLGLPEGDVSTVERPA